jgi:hypothetical protein
MLIEHSVMLTRLFVTFMYLLSLLVPDEYHENLMAFCLFRKAACHQVSWGRYIFALVKQMQAAKAAFTN